MPEVAKMETLPALDYISEDDLRTYEGWLRYQGFDLSTLSEQETAAVRELFDDSVNRRALAGKVGRMKLRRGPGVSTYAIAVRDEGDLWLALWIKLSAKDEVFIFHPTTDGSWNPHSSLHKDGTFHMKSHDKVTLEPRQKQPPPSIRGSEHLGAYMGFAPKSVGAVCEPVDFTEVFEVPPGILGPRNGAVTVDLFEPGSTAEPLEHPAEEVARHLFTATVPHVMARIFRT
jgi:hypothetical protein